MAFSKKIAMGLALTVAIGATASAQDSLALGVAVWAVQGTNIIIGAALKGTFLVCQAAYEGGKLVYKKIENNNSHYPQLKPESNCFGICNDSAQPWILKVPNNASWKSKDAKGKEVTKSQTGGIFVYSVPDPKAEQTKGINLIYLGDLAGKEFKEITLAPKQSFILYVDVNKFLGVKITDFLREFYFVDKNGKEIRYLMTRTTKSGAPMAFDPQSGFENAAYHTIAEVDNGPEIKLEEYSIDKDTVTVADKS